MQRGRHLELGVDHHFTGGLVVPAAVVDTQFAGTVVDAPFAVAEVWRRHRTGGLHQNAFPFLHVCGSGAEHFGCGQVVALAHDGRGDGVAVHTHNLGEPEVFIDGTGQGHEVAHRDGHFRIESEHAAVCTRAFLEAEQAAVHTSHNAADSHKGIGEHRRIEGLALLDGRNGDGAVHDFTAVVVDDGVGVVVVGRRVGATELLEVACVAGLDAVSEAAVDGAGHAVSIAQHGALLGVAIVSEIVHLVVAGSVVDRELAEIVGFARDGARDLAEHAFVLLEIGVCRGQHERGRKGVAAVQNGRRGSGQLGSPAEVADGALHEHAVTHGDLRGAVEQAATDKNKDAAPSALSILDGRVAAVHAGHDAPHEDGLTVKGAVVVRAHVLLDGADGRFLGKLTRAIVKISTRAVVHRSVVGAASRSDSDCGHHALGRVAPNGAIVGINTWHREVVAANAGRRL